MKHLISIVLLMLASSAQAAILELDLYSAGDNLITRDTESGLEWLDIPAATGVSKMQLATNELSTVYGFRLATFAELEELYVRAGAIIQSCCGIIIITSPSSLSLSTSHGWAETSPIPFLEQDGMPSSFIQPNSIVSMFYNINADNRTLTPAVESLDIYQSDFDSYPQYFSLVLVRDVTAVPLPAAIWLFGSGLMGLIGMALRRAT